MKSKLDDLARAKHISDCIIEIELFLKMYSLDELETNLMLRRALERSLEIIGEASIHLTEETKNNYPDIQWRGIKGFRNIVIHEYFGIDSDFIKLVITDELPQLKIVIQQIINQLQN
jgi:uncharacterized protein with HEPN domain